VADRTPLPLRPDARATEAEVVAFLSALAGQPPIETHISRVFPGPDRVWKVKKPVRLSFLDFSALADRERFCRRELALNAPHAPGLYRGVVPVVRRPDGALALGAEGEVVEWAVEMARIPDADFLDRVAERGGLTPALVEEIGEAVAQMHGRLAAIPGFDAAAAMARVIDGNAQAAREAGIEESEVALWQGRAEAWQRRLASWFAERARAGYVRRAHGDLHLANLCLWQGRVVPFDALEFDEELATIDLGYDLAFLLMDLERRAGRAAANRVLNRYCARTGDTALTRGLPLWLSSRAMVRAHVAARMGRAEDARDYLARAQPYLVPPPPVLVAIGGVPGTGKSTLARALAPELGPAPGALVLRSDELRKRLYGKAPEERLPAEAYTAEVSRAVYAKLVRLAAETIAAGHAAVADAVFLFAEERSAIEAARGPAPFLGLWLEAPVPVLEARIAARTRDASDADIAVLRAALGRDPGPIAWQRLDAAAPDLAARARTLLPNP